MNISSLKNAARSLEEGLKLYQDSRKEFTKDACIYRFKKTYDIAIQMMKRYLKENSCNPSEIEKFTFVQMIKKVHEESIILENKETWKVFRESRIKVSESFREDVSDDILAVIPGFLKEIQHFIKSLEE